MLLRILDATKDKRLKHALSLIDPTLYHAYPALALIFYGCQALGIEDTLVKELEPIVSFLEESKSLTPLSIKDRVSQHDLFKMYDRDTPLSTKCIWYPNYITLFILELEK